MLNTILTAFAEALDNLRTNFFQTFLSILGIIIGVGALVTMLALIDGLEKMARDGIAEKSSLESVNVSRRTHRRVDGIHIEMERVIDISRALMDSVLAELPYPAAAQIYASNNTMIGRPDTAEELAIRYFAVSLPFADEVGTVALGRELEEADESGSRAVTIVNHTLARRLAGKDAPLDGVLGMYLTIEGRRLEIVGIGEQQQAQPIMQAIFPFWVLSEAPRAPAYTTAAIVNFERIEDVRPGKEYIEGWFADRYPDIEEPVVASASVDMVESMEIGFTIFRLVMGFLIGIAVVVGGVGVMNIMLMSITERTGEIGVRKAVGANRRTIVTQFLSESVAISTLGSIFGLILGILFALFSAFVISQIADFEFTPVFTPQTLAVVGSVALVTGIIFGTYPARRAARLDPVVAIQRT